MSVLSMPDGRPGVVCACTANDVTPIAAAKKIFDFTISILMNVV